MDAAPATALVATRTDLVGVVGLRIPEPPIDQPPHPFEDLDDIDIVCPGCDYEGEAFVSSLLSNGVVVDCPSCGQEVYVELD